MQENIYKRTYFLPKNLMNWFTEWCNPGRDYSPKIAAAIAVFMKLPPDLREMAEKIAYKEDIEHALFDLEREIKDRMPKIADTHQLRNIIISVLQEYKLISETDSPDSSDSGNAAHAAVNRTRSRLKEQGNKPYQDKTNTG